MLENDFGFSVQLRKIISKKYRVHVVFIFYAINLNVQLLQLKSLVFMYDWPCGLCLEPWSWQEKVEARQNSGPNKQLNGSVSVSPGKDKSPWEMSTSRY